MGLKMGNSICDSRFSHLSRAVSTAVTELVLFLLIGSGDSTSSFDLLLLFHGAGISRFAADVEGMSPISASSFSSLIRVRPHFLMLSWL